ncbi:hypothetical protein [uncultured Shewanella sp.]|uniref:cyanobactin maturation protease PatG family protein n=1 Tax=uncultured Shewanella sp. TaxID=173975 RepID=UPI0026071ACE|nr:hypothetical protein [uncultured Shewanella sp.]
MNSLFTRDVTDENNLAQKLAVLAKTKQGKACGSCDEPVQLSPNHAYIYVVGFITAQFPSLSLEKAFEQSSSLTESQLGKVNDEVGLQRLNRNKQLPALLLQGLSSANNRNIAREMHWILDNVEGNETYTLVPSSHEKLTQLIAALSLTTKQEKVILVGSRLESGVIEVSHLIPANLKALTDVASLLKSGNKEFTELVDEILSMNANDGNTDNDRALNFVLYHNAEVYLKSYDFCYKSTPGGPNPSGYQLVNVRVRTSLSGERWVAKVIFDYQGINTGAKQSWYSAVDVTGEYPFLLVKWQRFLSHT